MKKIANTFKGKCKVYHASSNIKWLDRTPGLINPRNF
jgi:hypothetical protein